MDIIRKIAEELEVGQGQVDAAVKLIDEGCTIPFIARYRKEATGALNDEQLRTLGTRLTALRNLEEKKAKVLESIEAQGKLTPELAAQIEAYCNKNQIARRTAGRIQLVFEETAQMLVPMLDSPNIQAVCEYSEAAESAEWLFSYGGKRLDVTSSGDDLALSVLRGITEHISDQWVEDAEHPNQLRLTVSPCKEP